MTGSWRALVGSLRVKVAATVVVILAVAMGVVFAVRYHSFRREMLQRLGLAATPLSDVIKGSLRHAMLTRDLSGLAAIVDDVSRRPGVIKVFVLDKRGEIRVSPIRELNNPLGHVHSWPASSSAAASPASWSSRPTCRRCRATPARSSRSW